MLPVVYLGVLAAYCIIASIILRYALGAEAVGVALIVATLVAYVILAIIILHNMWRETRIKVVSPWLRVPIQTLLVAFLFSPTFAACGALAPLPFPLIIAMELVFRDGGCGQIKSFTTWNALYVVVPTWLLLTGGYAVRLAWLRRGAL